MTIPLNVSYVVGFRKEEYGLNNIPNTLEVPRSVRHRLISLTLSMNAIKQEYNKLIRPYDDAIMKLQEAIDINEGHRNIKIKLNKTLKRLIYLQEKSSCNDIPEQVFASLINLLPPKYVSYKKEEHEWVGRYTQRGSRIYLVQENPEDLLKKQLNITLIDVNIKALSWLEQQDELNRINLSREERALMLSMKESMRVHDDNVTFDSYIEDWAHHLLDKMNIPFIPMKEYARVMRKRYRERCRREKESKKEKVADKLWKRLISRADEDMLKVIDDYLSGDSKAEEKIRKFLKEQKKNKK